jgi:hypothetical protein
VDNASTAAAFLAVIALSDGLRLLPAGAIVVSRLAFGEWVVAGTAAARLATGGLRLITWCSPLLLPVVLRDTAHETLQPKRRITRVRARMRRIRSYVAVLRVGGVLTLAALIAGIPWLTARSGAWGLLLGVSVVLWLCVVQTVVAIAALRRTGLALGTALLASARFLWPFSAPRAAEEVMHRALAGAPALIALRELLSRDAFRGFARPLLFDAVVLGEQTGDVAELRAFLGESEVADILNEPPLLRDGDAYCPRCGASFYRVARFCSDCAEVELRAQAAG